MSEAFLMGLVCLLSYIVGVVQTTLMMKDKQSDSVRRANDARESVTDEDLSTDKYNRDICLILALCLLVGGCVCKAPNGNYCDVARPITFSGDWDTRDTIHQIRQHNAVYRELCE